jgi:hypothetical protein
MGSSYQGCRFSCVVNSGNHQLVPSLVVKIRRKRIYKLAAVPILPDEFPIRVEECDLAREGGLVCSGDDDLWFSVPAKGSDKEMLRAEGGR